MKSSSLLSLGILGLFLGNSFAYDCSATPQYVDGSVYNTGSIVQNNGKAFDCDVGGWCSIGGAYAPGEGWASGHAWAELGDCETSISSSLMSSSIPLSSSSSEDLVSSSSLQLSSSTQGTSCEGISSWQAQVYNWTGVKEYVVYNSSIYSHTGWVNATTPDQNADWTLEGSCNDNSQSSEVVSSSSLLSSSSVSSSSARVFTSLDVGNTGALGSTTVSGEQIVLQGSGGDIWDKSDAFQFYYTDLVGDGQITVKVNDVQQADIWTKTGVMIRDGLGHDDANAFMMIGPTEGAGMQHRSTAGASTSSYMVPKAKPVRWLRLVREGDQYTSSYSHDGLCWTKVDTKQATMTGTDYIGLALTSHSFGNFATTAMSDLAVENEVEAFNASCPRAAVDGLPAAPTDFVLLPGKLGTSVWKYTFNNPNASSSFTNCEFGGGKRDGDDDPQCPSQIASPQWTQDSFDDLSWSTGEAGFGSFSSNGEDIVKTNWSTSNQNIWLRREFTVSENDIDDLVFWGRSDDGITIYINGVLASSNRKYTGHYRYLGLSNEARASLSSTNSNTIAIRVRNGDYEKANGTDGRFFDFGIAKNPALANIPVSVDGIQAIPEMDAVVEAVREYMAEQGITGGAFALMKDEQVLVSRGFGYSDKELTKAMKHDAIMRLASNDKVVTLAAIKKLVAEGYITDLNSSYFSYFPDLLPAPGTSVGNQVEQITIQHLLDHKSGVNYTGEGQGSANEKYSAFGIDPSDWNAEYTLRWLYGKNTLFTPGSEGRYSSDGYFMLRYLVEKVTGGTMEAYLTHMLSQVNTTDMNVSYELLAERDISEPGYVFPGGPYDRWINLEHFLALGSSAEAFVKFLYAYDLGTGNYLLGANGVRNQNPNGGGFFGSMGGTFSYTGQYGGSHALSFAVIFNNSGYFDEVVSRIDGATVPLIVPGGVLEN